MQPGATYTLGSHSQRNQRSFFHSRAFLGLLILTCLLGALACGVNKQAGESCYGTYECVPGLFCLNGKCILSGRQSCENSGQCNGNFVCRFKLCVARNTLTPCSLQDPCMEGQKCQDGYCTRSGEGRKCTREVDCPTGLYCDDDGKVCRIGSRCDTDEECADGFVCEENLCVEERQRSECTATEDCSDGEACVDGQCEVL